MNPRSIPFLVLLAAMMALPHVGWADPNSATTESMVVEALGHLGISVDATQVQLPSGVTAIAGKSLLQVSSIEMLADRRLRARLTCQEKRACQPFYAFVIPPRGQPDSAWNTKTQVEKQQGDPVIENTSAQRVLAGQHAVLIMEDEHMRITLPVIAIDTGQQGADIRVSSLDRKQTFAATVSGPGIVRSSLR